MIPTDTPPKSAEVRRPNPWTDLSFYTEEWCRARMTSLLEYHPRPWGVKIINGKVKMVDALDREITSQKFVNVALAAAVNRFGNPWEVI